MASPIVLGAGTVAVVVLLACSALFSSAETAIFTLPPDWADARADDLRAEDPRAAMLATLRADPHRLLVTLLVGNNVVNVALASVVTVLVGGFLPPGPAVLATTAVASLLVLVFGEIVPKAYGLGNAAAWAVTVAPAVRAVEWALSPLISALDAVTGGMNRLLDGDREIERPYVD